MNSEVLKDFENTKTSFIEKEREKRLNLEADVKEKGELAEAFTRHPFWMQFDKDLEKLIEDLNNKLLNSADLKKTQMDKLIQAINMTKLFRKSPRGYIDKMQMLVSRSSKRLSVGKGTRYGNR